MSNMSDFLEAGLRTLIFRTGTFARPTGLWISLHTAPLVDAGTGTEVTGGSYARFSAGAPLNATWNITAAPTVTVSNASAMTWPVAPTGVWGTPVTHIGIWDASTAGNLWCHAALGTPKNIGATDPAPSFAPGTLQIQMDPTGKMSDFLETALGNFIFRTTPTLVKPAGLFISLHTADPTDAGTGTEVTGGSYARVSRAPLDANWSIGTATDGVITNTAALTWPAPTATWGTPVSHYGIWDASTAGNLHFYGPLGSPRNVNSGDAAPTMAGGVLSVTFA